jgi:hypothetical protein
MAKKSAAMRPVPGAFERLLREKLSGAFPQSKTANGGANSGSSTKMKTGMNLRFLIQFEANIIKIYAVFCSFSAN